MFGQILFTTIFDAQFLKKSWRMDNLILVLLDENIILSLVAFVNLNPIKV
jgi:hypothetical protein